MNHKSKLQKLEDIKIFRNIEFLHHKANIMMKLNSCTNDFDFRKLSTNLQSCKNAQRLFNEKIDRKISNLL